MPGAADAVGNPVQHPKYEPFPLGTQFSRGIAILQAGRRLLAGTTLD